MIGITRRIPRSLTVPPQISGGTIAKKIPSKSNQSKKRLPADLTAAELRVAARLIAKVAETLPEQKKHAITLLDRALSTEPEDDDTKKLRDSLR